MKILRYGLAILALLAVVPACAQNTYINVNNLPVPATGSTQLSNGDKVVANRNGVTYGLLADFGSNCTAHQWINLMSAQGYGTCSQPQFSDIAGALQLSQIAGSYTDGQILIGDSSTNQLVANTITQGSGITIVNGHHTITISASGSGSSSLSALTAATATNTIDNATYAQTWNWNSATTQNALSLTSATQTSGNLVSLSMSNSSSTATGAAVVISNASTGAGYGVKSSMAGSGNTGYAIYGSNSSTSGWGIYSAGTSPNYFGGSIGISSTAPRTSLDLSQKTDAVILPIGTTGTRPATGVNGMVRYNSTTPALEGYVNNSWQAISTSSSNIYASSGMTTAASGATNATALQAAITTQTAIGTSASNPYAAVQAIGLPAGVYAVSSAVSNNLAAVKLISQAGPVEMNYVGIGTTSVGLTITNDSNPTGEFTARNNGANDGCVINGTNGNIDFVGPLSSSNTSTASVGVQWGSSTAVSSDDHAMRFACISHAQFQNWGYGLLLNANNMYMNSFDHINAAYNNCGVATRSASSNTNSGENIQFRTGDDSQNNYAFCDQTPNIDTVWDGFSFDANATADFLETSNAGYSTTRVINSHLEDFNVAPYAVDASGICSSGIGADAGNTNYIFENDKFVWNSGSEVPFNHFKGCVGLTLMNNTFAGYGTFSNSAALTAYYMTDANVVLNKVSGNYFPDNVTQKQLIAASANVIQDPTFAKGTNTGNFLTTPSTLPTWLIDATQPCTGLTPTVDTTTTWSAGSGVASMKFTYSAGSNGCTVDSSKFPVQPGDHLIGDIIVNGGTSTGTGTIVGLYFNWLPCNPSNAVTNSNEIGDDLNVVYGGGARNTAAKVQTLVDAKVPAGICWAQLAINPFGVPSGKSIWVLDAEVNKI